ncbi:MAG: VOC family protein [Bacteroidota bacterium]
MHTAFETFRPKGFTSVNTYLFTENPQELIDFLKAVFFAEEHSRVIGDGDLIRNCILQIGDTCIMIAQASGPFLGMRTALYLYVKDVDATYQRALEKGASTVFAAADMEFGDRQAGIQDVAGNYWWISTRLVKGSY